MASARRLWARVPAPPREATPSSAQLTRVNAEIAAMRRQRSAIPHAFPGSTTPSASLPPPLPACGEGVSKRPGRGQAQIVDGIARRFESGGEGDHHTFPARLGGEQAVDLRQGGDRRSVHAVAGMMVPASSANMSNGDARTAHVSGPRLWPAAECPGRRRPAGRTSGARGRPATAQLRPPPSPPKPRPTHPTRRAAWR
jgi:hypothetical protein